MRRGGHTLSAQQLVDQVNREGAVVVDVRDRKEFDAGHIVGAINVPYSSLDSRIDELRKFAEKTHHRHLPYGPAFRRRRDASAQAGVPERQQTRRRHG
jgi:rhodanese-related sulfurtransferase